MRPCHNLRRKANNGLKSACFVSTFDNVSDTFTTILLVRINTTTVVLCNSNWATCTRRIISIIITNNCCRNNSWVSVIEVDVATDDAVVVVDDAATEDDAVVLLGVDSCSSCVSNTAAEAHCSTLFSRGHFRLRVVTWVEGVSKSNEGLDGEAGRTWGLNTDKTLASGFVIPEQVFVSIATSRRQRCIISPILATLGSLPFQRSSLEVNSQLGLQLFDIEFRMAPTRDSLCDFCDCIRCWCCTSNLNTPSKMTHINFIDAIDAKNVDELVVE